MSGFLFVPQSRTTASEETTVLSRHGFSIDAFMDEPNGDGTAFDVGFVIDPGVVNGDDAILLGGHYYRGVRDIPPLG